MVASKRNLLVLLAVVIIGVLVFILTRGGAPVKLMPDHKSLRQTDSGKVIGTADVGVYNWRGIPFAQPPVGALRWRAPRAAEPWPGVRATVEPGSRCIQIGHLLGGASADEAGQPVGSEDCLYLNVTAPQDAAAGAGLPVMFWIHGGANLVGTASSYNFAELVRQEQVVVVTINYRLGQFGWFSHPVLRETASSADDATANFAVLDMVMALRWVQQNIAGFGGDPNRVTIFGESAGGADVFTLMVTPQAQGLFHGAIAQSGSLHSQSQQAAEQAGGERGNTADMQALWERDNPPQGESAASRVAWLQTLDAGMVLTSYPGGLGGLPEVPRMIRDGVVIPQEGTRAVFERGGQHPVPLITGTNRNELKLFMALSPSLVDVWFGMQYFIRDEALYDRIDYYSTGAWKARAVDSVAMLETPAPVWAYRFDWDEEPSFLWTDFSKVFGAAHAFEIPFVSGSIAFASNLEAMMFSDENRASVRELSRAMMGYWANFARIGQPADGAGVGPVWTTWAESRSHLLFDTDADGGVRLQPTALTFEALAEELAQDPLFPDLSARCQMLYGMVEPQRFVELSQTWNSGECKNFAPSESF